MLGRTSIDDRVTLAVPRREDERVQHDGCMRTDMSRSHDDPLHPHAELRVSNVDCAAFPQAIATAGQRKLPISDNDPTRDIPPFARALRPVLLALATAALAVLAAGTLVVLLERS